MPVRRRRLMRQTGDLTSSHALISKNVAALRRAEERNAKRAFVFCTAAACTCAPNAALWHDRAAAVAQIRPRRLKAIITGVRPLSRR